MTDRTQIKFNFLDHKRFLKRVDKSAGPDECWPWQGSRDQKGYGFFHKKDFNFRAHRVAWIFENGPIPEGLLICHKCNNPSCVNPSHLFTGTQKENMAQAAQENRTNRKGPESYLAELVRK